MDELYYDWMISKVCNRIQKRRYSVLLQFLNDVPYHYTVPMDSNRESDGAELYRTFAYETGNSDDPSYYNRDLEDGCSVLEMMVALAIKLENIMDNFKSDTTGQWFWYMIDSLGLSYMDNHHFDAYGTSDILECWMDGIYDGETGVGGLFILPDNHGEDLTKVEVWCQAMWYLGELYNV